MSNPEEHSGGEFPPEEMESLLTGIRQRITEFGSPGGEFCNMIDKLIDFQISNTTPGVGMSMALQMFPTFGPELARFLHLYGHLCFEFGRQFALSYPDLSDLTADDIRKGH